MKPLVDCLAAFVGGSTLTNDLPLLTAADARAAKLPREHGVLYGDAVLEAIEQLSIAGPCTRDSFKAAYYLGLQIGWRTAHRVR
jgi:hypothetical protein